jgi:hypothetical protein
LVALADRTRGPIRHSCGRPDRRALRADAGGREPGPNFHGASISDQTLRLDHCVAMDPLPKKCWVGGLAPLRSCNLPSRARLGAVADRNPVTVEVDGSDTLREGLLTTPVTEYSCSALLLNSAFLPLYTQNPSWRMEWKRERNPGSAPQGTPYCQYPSWWRIEKRKKPQISVRAAVRALLTLSFLPKTAFVPVFETEISYP